MSTMKMLIVLIIIGVTAPSYAEERIWLKAKINDKPVHLVFDTGSNGNALCPQTVQKLGLKFIPTATNDLQRGLMAGDTELCTVTLDGTKFQTRFLVLNLPAYLNADFDGLIGWCTLNLNVLRIDAVAGKVEFLQKLPTNTSKWTRFPVLTNFNLLDLQIQHSDRTNGVVCIDTGSGGGLGLPAREWNRWRTTHPHSPITLATDFSPDDGFYVKEEAWADQISVGPLVLTDVPIAQAGPNTATRWGAQYEGTFGLAALKRLDFIVDGEKDAAYFRAKTTSPPTYSHNRLGAVFVPTVEHLNQAVARVVDGGPAYEAGVRNGDILLQVDDIVITGWSDDWRSRFYMADGTKLILTLERDGKTFKTTAILRQILQPSFDRNK